MPFIRPENVYLHKLINPLFKEFNVSVSIVRLDKIHSEISGNKWFKILGYLQDAKKNGFNGIATFGGAYSNHILATAAICKLEGLNCIGFIRGEEPEMYSATLQEAKDLGMTLVFLSRTDFQLKNLEVLQKRFPGYYFIREGGYGDLGTVGIKNIFQWIPSDTNYIVAACGTGTTLAGLIRYALPDQKIIGINVLKGYEAITNDIEQILPPGMKYTNWTMFNEYHFGGYAKKNDKLIQFMNEMWDKDSLPTDFVYESKMMYGLLDLVQKGYFPPESKIVAIHSGGLQGNRSLPEGTLHF